MKTLIMRTQRACRQPDAAQDTAGVLVALSFPFFSNMLSEGRNRAVQSRLLHIDENDHFGILLATAQTDVAGAVTVKPL